MEMLKNKTILVSGVLTTRSIAFHTAQLAQEEGATVILTGYGRLSLVERIARKLPSPPPVLELDITNPEQLASLPGRLAHHTDRLDGVLHSVAFAPPRALGGNFMTTEWEDVAQAVHVSAYSLKSLTQAVLPLLGERSSVVGLDFDSSRAWDEYDWMGVAKAGLESCARYLASYLGQRGVRVNLVAAGPLHTMAASSISSEEGFDAAVEWGRRAPLGWDGQQFEPVARACVALLSDWFPATTGEIVHVDGGAHAIGDRPGGRRA